MVGKLTSYSLDDGICSAASVVVDGGGGALREVLDSGVSSYLVLGCNTLRRCGV